MFTLGDIPRKGQRIYGSKDAIVFKGVRLTYRSFNERVNRLANALLGFGFQKGERISILSENTYKYLEVYFAAAKAGLAVTPLNFRLAEDELVHIVDDSEARLIFVGDGYEAAAERMKPRVPQVVDLIAMDNATAGMLSYEDMVANASAVDPEVAVHENDMAILMYTGGTTGLPKGVMLSHRNLMTAMTCLVQQFGFTSNDTTCMLLPLFHVSFWPAFSVLLVGGTVALVRRPDLGEILPAIQDEKCTHINAVPTLYNWMLDDPRLDQFDLSSLRMLGYAGSPIPEQVLRRLIAKFGNICAQGYGLTEAAPVVSALMPEDHAVDGPKAKLLRSVGKEALIVEVRIVDDAGVPVAPGQDGEVVVRGPNIMLGYWKNPEMTADRLRDGWLHTGDVGVLDEDGYLYLVDRKADMIVTGGENVYPTETENVLHQHPAVQECAVVSAPDEKWGERVQAAVVVKKNESVTEAELINFCKARLAGYKCPKKIEFWDLLPKTPVGKILRKDVKKKFWEGYERSIG